MIELGDEFFEVKCNTGGFYLDIDYCRNQLFAFMANSHPLIYENQEAAIEIMDRLNEALRPENQKAADPPQFQGHPPIDQRIEEVQLTFRAVGLISTKEVAHKFILTLGYISKDGDISIKKLAEIDARLDEIYKEETT